MSVITLKDAQVVAGSGATISPCGRYRYLLWRTWGEGPKVTWIMLNPSTADADRDDPTIRRCVGFARTWGSTGIEVVNLFALRSTDPKALINHHDPVGPENDFYLSSPERGIVVAGWGTWGGHAKLAYRVEEAKKLLAKHLVFCLGRAKDGQPRHPLMLRRDA